MSKKSHVQRTLKYLRGQGINYAVASWYSQGQRHDLLGVLDYVAFFPNDHDHSGNRYRLIGLQICGSDFQPHVRKIESSKLAWMWLESGNEILLIGWTFRKKQGVWVPRKKIWQGGDLTYPQSTPLTPKFPKPRVDLL